MVQNLAHVIKSSAIVSSDSQYTGWRGEGFSQQVIVLVFFYFYYSPFSNGLSFPQNSVIQLNQELIIIFYYQLLIKLTKKCVKAKNSYVCLVVHSSIPFSPVIVIPKLF